MARQLRPDCGMVQKAIDTATLTVFSLIYSCAVTLLRMRTKALGA